MTGGLSAYQWVTELGGKKPCVVCFQPPQHQGNSRVQEAWLVRRMVLLLTLRTDYIPMMSAKLLAIFCFKLA